MIFKNLWFLCCLIIMLGAVTFASAQKSSKTVSVVGCYSDLREIPEGIIGNGIIRISKKSGTYFGTFAELQNELGLASDEMPLENLIVEQSKSIITFTFGGRGRVTGKITKAGIQMNWGNNRGAYGTAKSFMKRGKDC
jgi:hypothetical protein